jgi:hypothetical protein
VQPACWSPLRQWICAVALTGFTAWLSSNSKAIRYLDPDVKGKSQQGYLWAYSRPGGDVLYEWQVSRTREGPEKFLKSFRGKLQTDGYAAYESLAKERDDLILVRRNWSPRQPDLTSRSHRSCFAERNISCDSY